MKHRILIIQKHPIFSQGIQEMLRRKRDVELVEIAPEGADATTLIQQKQIDVVIIDAKEWSTGVSDSIAFLLRDDLNVKVIAVTPDHSRMYAYGKRAVESADVKALLAAIRGGLDSLSPNELREKNQS